MLNEYQKIIDYIFANETSVTEKFKNICKNLRISYYKSDSDLMLKHPRYRLFMTLPYFLFKIQEISCQEFLGCNKCHNEEEFLKFFLNLWEKNN